ncbi:Oligosaccharyltransferase subunit Ribophorin II-domain-containing protein [Mycotypha africana]|uniref:Oligosaccharyltransferase subunit Ribophorin II-domain-containing protein n=1 Tax=Mycotypha africana TaxID=64632 RepID=UPI002300422C|nr:Oligosaccharyltransferase subunit Ribophorin II-domain-containing protein [Mycotypha africana]KAI8979257.1 Oligosaccharyltransferase subunit Ribophorin II-domain-containing protein [Mycotypha africana]
MAVMKNSSKVIFTFILTMAISTCVVKAAGDEDIFELQPEIHHMFRPAEKMPPAAFSQLFTLLTLAPWAILALGWFKLEYTPKKIISELIAGPITRTASIIVFLASLISIEVLFYLYWTRLNLFQTLPYLAGLTIITFFTGQRALSALQNRRLANYNDN